MLTREQINQRLEAFRQKDWLTLVLARLAKAPARVASVARGILDVDEQGKYVSDWRKRNELRDAAQTQLMTLSPEYRRLLFGLLLPRLVEQVAAAWQLRDRLPYLLHSARRPFRAPGDESALAAARFAWFSLVVRALRDYLPPDAAWVAAHAGYLGSAVGNCLGVLLAAAIDQGGDVGEEVFSILKESATNEHEVGCMGRHVSRALLVCSREEAWTFMEKMLLAAQRQEGLRQVILETIDETHPQAFRRMLRLILEHDLVRFSSVVRAVDVWLGLRWDSASAGVIKTNVEGVLRFLDDAAAREEAQKTEKGEPLYLALWATGFEDVHAAIRHAAGLAKDPELERRFIAVHFLSQTHLPAAEQAMPAFLDDDDSRVVMTALRHCPAGADLFDKLLQIVPRLPEKPTSPTGPVWPWIETYVSRAAVNDKLITYLGKRPTTVLLPHLDGMSGSGKRKVIEKLKELKRYDGPTREALLKLVGDRDTYVRRRAREALEKCTVEEAEAQRLEGMLTRKTSDMRRGVINLLVQQKPAAALASADRLTASRKLPLRIGGLAVLRELVTQGKEIAECQRRVAQYLATYPEPGIEEAYQLEFVRDHDKPRPTLDDALGLMDARQRTKPTPPRVRKVTFMSKAALACLQSLDDLVHQNKQTPIRLKNEAHDQLLGSITVWRFPQPREDVIDEQERTRLPLLELWQKWYRERDKGLIDRDGCELLRALLWQVRSSDWHDPEKRKGDHVTFYDHTANGFAPVKLRYGGLVSRLLAWLVRLHPPANGPEFLIEALESCFALVRPEAVEYRLPSNPTSEDKRKDWRHVSPHATYFASLSNLLAHVVAVWTPDHAARWWKLLHWRDEPVDGVARYRPDLRWLTVARDTGAANEADLYDQLLGPKQDFKDLKRLTEHPVAEAYAGKTEILAVAARCRDRVIEIELARGENPVASSAPARALSSAFGLELLMKCLATLGTRPFALERELGRPEVLTHLVAVTHPLSQDTVEAFAARVKEAKVPTERLLQMAFLSPQWCRFVEHALGWTGLREAVWWFFAHGAGGRADAVWAADDARQPGFDRKKVWERILGERTSLTDAERGEGMIDVDWFRRVYEPMGRERWGQIADAARSAGDARGAKKALFISDVILGRVKKSEIVKKITDKASRESVRFLGLLPLAKGAAREGDLQSRYRVFMTYRKYARALSPMGREGALRDLTIGLSNLARTAGYPDPIRLEWSMEAREIADLAAGPVSLTREGVTVSLSLDADNKTQLSVKRGEKALKSIPAAVKKDPKVAALVARQAEIRRQASRVKQSLESAMVRGDVFSGAELKQLFTHPLLKPWLERLVLIGEGIMGFPTAGGQALEDHAGKLEPVKADEKLRIAHAHDLFVSGAWDRWQANCFQRERVQPFKQVFRELYVVTQQEKEDGTTSHRYAGQQINPKQAMALWGSRSWNTRDEISKTYHEARIVAQVWFRHHGWTPLEVEGLTLDGISFRRRNEYKAMLVTEVPPILFSETMRDCDLVVSVAHRGGIDPEASASTVQMRTSLLRETCSLLGIENYRVQKQHVLIDGKLNHYSVHLGSAVVHRQPGGSLCIVPVHAQHRGRLFLPFADDDPRTAEVISKVLLLARDHEIQDPTILEQLR